MFFLTGFLSCKQGTDDYFQEIPASESNISFSNQLQLGGEVSVLEFEYMYNGAGVAVADFDLDGLQDIYFTGNMVSNRLYRNLGDWKFEDLTEQAGVGSSGWSNGVAVVDINQDGYPDIYVCRGGPRNTRGRDRANLLFLNKGPVEGKLAFEEVAEDWGLADESYSVQAAFFDYDGDGDLDMYLLSNALVDFNRNTSRPIDRSGKAPSVDKLFRNNGDRTYSDVSQEAGITIEGFGLGVEICDINLDGWPDIYVSNDFLTDDILYINHKDGTFVNETGRYFKHLTFNGMGNDIGDINNDGLMDVVVLDMLPEDNERWKLTMMGNNYDQFQTGLSYGYQPQYIRNTLQVNNGNGTFSEVGQLAGISATEWSWSALLADFDHDGLKDLCVTNGYRQDITNLDFMVYGNQVLSMGTEEANRKDRLEALNKLPGIKLPNYFFRNTGNLRFEDRSEEAGFTKPTYSNGMAYADFDNDGDLDLVINNIDEPAGLFRNNADASEDTHYMSVRFRGQAPNREGLGSQVALYYGGEVQKQYFTPFRGYLSTVEQGLHFGLGAVAQIDSLVVTWPDGRRQSLKGVKANQQIVLDYKDAIAVSTVPPATRETLFHKIDSLGAGYRHTEDDFVDFKIQPLLPHMHSRNGPGLAVGDVNADGREDLYVGGAAGQAGALLIQQGDGGFERRDFEGAAPEDMGALFFDTEGDGDLDLYVVSGGSSYEDGDPRYQDRIYENDGHGNFKRIVALPGMNVSGSVVAAADYNKDGHLDLFVGGRLKPGEYPMPPSSYLLKNVSTPQGIRFVKDSLSMGVDAQGLGMVTAALWTDFDRDTWPDLIIVGEFMPIRIFKNKKGKLEEITSGSGLKNTHGWWNSITAGDFDQDGDSDYILGNLGLNARYRATAEEPLCIYAADYDNNGLIDPVMCYYIDGENYVAHSRNDLIEQISAMRGRFRTYSDYARATFKESFRKEELEEAHIVKAETFANSYLENLGSGKFRLTALPRQAQIAPIYGTLVADFNNDTHPDVLAVGNFYSGEVFAGRYDASIGWFLAGDGKGGFNAVQVGESGFFVDGDAKALVNLQGENGPMAIASINDGPLKAHAHSGQPGQIYRAGPTDVGAVISYDDGTREFLEFFYGAGYLSQSSRSLFIPSKARALKIIDRKGQQTEIPLVK